MDVVLKIDVVKGKAIDWPRLEDSTTSWLPAAAVR